MENIIYYSAHFKLIQLPALAHHEDIPEPQEVIPLTEITIAAPSAQTEDVMPLAQAHQQYIKQQAAVFQYFLQHQQLLLQQTLALINDNEASENNIILPEKSSLPGPKFSRQDLEQLASGNISPFFGDWFKRLDQYKRLVRMPEPPLLLADRVTGIDAKAGSLSTGTIWTETDVTADAWYLHDGYMPAGIMIESGQADLLLASWLGFDFYNKGQRIYRLLGCELSYHGGLPKPGDTLCYDIHIDGQAKQGDIRLFFFHYDCHINGELRLKVRHGQAGFFSDQELAESGGVLWDPATESCDTTLQLDKPKVSLQQNHFSKEQLQKFSQGDVYGCFGNGFEWTLTHTRTPHISSGKMLFIDEITAFDIQGGPWQRGYMRAIQHVHPNDWFFQGHFKNDPCMPGTLMLEAGLQVMACYLTGLGYTIDKDGWRFEPIQEQAYKLRCRGQVRPEAKQVVYEIFVYSVIAAPIPMLFAELLATVDGLKAFHTKIGLRLIPDWPLTQQHPLLRNHIEPKPVAEVNGFKFDYQSLLACAWGKPSTAFGELYKPFDNYRHVARLPGPPYHFMSRINNISSEMGGFKIGTTMECEYDIPTDAWYFKSENFPTMPFAVLLEIALQPCGWLASYMGSALRSKNDLVFRNLDGIGTVTAEVLPAAGSILTKVKCTNIFESGDMIIESFQVENFINDKLIYKMDTVFGFFPQNAFENQVGLPIPEHEKTALVEASDFKLDLTTKPEAFFGGGQSAKLLPGLPDEKLLMIDRITGFWPNGGRKNLGRVRAEKTVRAAEWFFKAHFFQDPVQPGSLGIEAMIQLLQVYMLQKGMHHNIDNAHFQPLALDKPLTWKYRGQVTPDNKLVSVIIDIIEEGYDEQGVYVIAESSLWVDGKRIYEAKNLGMRLVANDGKKLILHDSFSLDPEKEIWIKDHCPTYVLPTLPMMSMVEYIIQAARKYFPQKKITSLHDVQVFRWLVVDKAIQIHVDAQIRDGFSVLITLLAEEKNQLKPFAKGIVIFADEYPLPSVVSTVPLQNSETIANPYLSLFHGPVFQIVRSLTMGSNGSFSVINVPNKNILGANHILLDAVTHGIPHDNLTHWDTEILPDNVGYPILIPQFSFFCDAPIGGQIKCVVRFAGFHHSKQYPKFDINLFIEEKLWASFQLVDAIFPKGPLGSVTPERRRLFLHDKQYVPDMALSIFENNQTKLSTQTVKNSDWLPGSVAKLYDIADDNLENITKQVAIKEHFARQFKIHPSKITIVGDKVVISEKSPTKKYKFQMIKHDDEFKIENV